MFELESKLRNYLSGSNNWKQMSKASGVKLEHVNFVSNTKHNRDALKKQGKVLDRSIPTDPGYLVTLKNDKVYFVNEMQLMDMMDYNKKAFVFQLAEVIRNGQEKQKKAIFNLLLPSYQDMLSDYFK